VGLERIVATQGVLWTN